MADIYFSGPVLPALEGAFALGPSADHTLVRPAEDGKIHLIYRKDEAGKTLSISCAINGNSHHLSDQNGSSYTSVSGPFCRELAAIIWRNMRESKIRKGIIDKLAQNPDFTVESFPQTSRTDLMISFKGNHMLEVTNSVFQRHGLVVEKGMEMSTLRLSVKIWESYHAACLEAEAEKVHDVADIDQAIDNLEL